MSQAPRDRDRETFAMGCLGVLLVFMLFGICDCCHVGARVRVTSPPVASPSATTAP